MCIAFVIFVEMFRDETDGTILMGAIVEIYSMSGETILQTETGQDMLCSEFCQYFSRRCAVVVDIPYLCAKLVWKPPIRRCTGNLQTSQLIMQATLMPTCIPPDLELFGEEGCGAVENCLICYDPAEDIGDTDFDRSSNCIRYEPCSLCEKCKINIGGCLHLP